MRICKLIISIGITSALMAVIFMLSSQDSSDSGTLSTAVARMLATAFVPGFEGMDAMGQAEVLEFWAWPVRKTAHATEYACLAISLCATCWQIWAFRRERTGKSAESSQPPCLSICLVAFLVAVLYACTDEVHQLFIDGRAGQVTDVLVDGSGALVGCLLCYLCMRIALRLRGPASS